MRNVSIKRIGLGLLVSIGVLLLGHIVLLALHILSLFDSLSSLLPTNTSQAFFYLYVLPAIQGFIVFLVAAFCGARVAQVRFLIAAVLLAIGTWVLVVIVLNSTVAAAGQISLLQVASANLLRLVFSIAGAAVGALLGHRSSHRSERHQAGVA